MKNVAKIYVGVDVSKNFLDVAIRPTEEHFKVSNDKLGITKMMKRLSAYNVIRVAFESSGGYEYTAIKMLRRKDYHVELIDPKLVRYFILSKRVKAKTDKIDAHMIALYTECNQPEHIKLIPSQEHEELRDMVRRRHDFVEDIAREKKRFQQTQTQKSKSFICNHIDYLKKQIELADIELKTLINSCDEWKQKQKILLSIPGIGFITAVTLIAEMIELGHIENKQAASLLGVAPFVKQSGTYQGKATISGGRFIARKIFYMAALSASHAKGKFGKYYQRLRNKGKKGKICLVALMNKMIKIANALLRKKELWNPSFA